jgi:hypothetical protein
MRGATCAIFIATLLFSDKCKRVQCSKVPFQWYKTVFNINCAESRLTRALCDMKFSHRKSNGQKQKRPKTIMCTPTRPAASLLHALSGGHRVPPALRGCGDHLGV